MGVEQLGTRDLKGYYFLMAEEYARANWAGLVAAGPLDSDQATETYKDLGTTPAMREAIGGKQVKKLRDVGLTITNVEYEATIGIAIRDLRRDKLGKARMRIAQLAARAETHWNKLLTNLIILGETALCYDGQAFFDTDHLLGDSGTQDNDISHDITTTTAPTVVEINDSIMLAIEQMMGLKDDQGEPMNEGASEFLVMVPVPYFKVAAAAIKSEIITDSNGMRTNVITNLDGFAIRFATNPRLTWTTKLAVFRTDGPSKALIMQEEVAAQLTSLEEGSDHAYKNQEYLFSVEATRGVGYGNWQHGCLVTHT